MTGEDNRDYQFYGHSLIDANCAFVLDMRLKYGDDIMQEWIYRINSKLLIRMFINNILSTFISRGSYLNTNISYVSNLKAPFFNSFKPKYLINKKLFTAVYGTVDDIVELHKNRHSDEQFRSYMRDKAMT